MSRSLLMGISIKKKEKR